MLAVTPPMWDRYEDRAALRAEAAAAKQAGKKQSTLNIPGVKGALATFFLLCHRGGRGVFFGAPATWWKHRGFQQRRRPGACRCYFLGITLGRFLSGFASMRMKGAALIRLGQLVSAGGAVLLMLPLPAGSAWRQWPCLGWALRPCTRV